MGSNDLPPVWIGTPQRGTAQEDVSDPYTSKIGGQAVYFRVGTSAKEQQGAAALSRHFQCPQCRSTSQVSLLCQVYAPLEVYDRVLYVLTCAACARRPTSTGASSHGAAPPSALSSGAGKKSSLAAAAAAKSLTSFCFAVRSQNFSRDFFADLQRERQAAMEREGAAKRPDAHGDAPLFGGGDDDWGDGEDDWGADGSPAEEIRPSPAIEDVDSNSACKPAEAVMLSEQPTYPLAVPGMTVPLKGTVYTSGLPLDLYEEPPPKRRKELTIEEQLAAAESLYGSGAAVDTSGFEEDDETPAEECVREYMEQMELAPSQCVRWCPGGAPLRTSIAPVGVNGDALPPPCPACGGARQFEMQLTAPVVYYLTRDIGEVKNTALHFSNVLVYTCSNHCYSTSSSHPYLPEYVVVEDEM
ncbi:Programmed cell death protein 2, C-terminal putative domain containing protein [Novymonas esmeraldas]|uniref:Programmed cell death protein 2, C-terminal putative domain containing protein n=1 Tax=Novymonas esmeraldas TaxID=1808958 RepID=A0AAW0ER03_9TRYP